MENSGISDRMEKLMASLAADVSTIKDTLPSSTNTTVGVAPSKSGLIAREAWGDGNSTGEYEEITGKASEGGNSAANFKEITDPGRGFGTQNGSAVMGKVEGLVEGEVMELVDAEEITNNRTLQDVVQQGGDSISITPAQSKDRLSEVFFTPATSMRQTEPSREREDYIVRGLDENATPGAINGSGDIPGVTLENGMEPGVKNIPISPPGSSDIGVAVGNREVFIRREDITVTPVVAAVLLDRGEENISAGNSDTVASSSRSQSTSLGVRRKEDVVELREGNGVVGVEGRFLKGVNDSTVTPPVLLSEGVIERSESLEVLPLIDVDKMSSMDEEESWLYKSTEHLPGLDPTLVVSPYEWVREEFEHPPSSPRAPHTAGHVPPGTQRSAAVTLKHQLEQVNQSPSTVQPMGAIVSRSLSKQGAVIPPTSRLQGYAQQPPRGPPSRGGAPPGGYAPPPGGPLSRGGAQGGYAPPPGPSRGGPTAGAPRVGSVSSTTNGSRLVAYDPPVNQRSSTDRHTNQSASSYSRSSQSLVGGGDARRGMGGGGGEGAMVRTGSVGEGGWGVGGGRGVGWGQDVSVSEENLYRQQSLHKLNDVTDVKALARLQEESLREDTSPLTATRGLSKSLNRSSGALVSSNLVPDTARDYGTHDGVSSRMTSRSVASLTTTTGPRGGGVGVGRTAGRGGGVAMRGGGVAGGNRLGRSAVGLSVFKEADVRSSVGTGSRVPVPMSTTRSSMPNLSNRNKLSLAAQPHPSLRATPGALRSSVGSITPRNTGTGAPARPGAASTRGSVPGLGPTRGTGTATGGARGVGAQGAKTPLGGSLRNGTTVGSGRVVQSGMSTRGPGSTAGGSVTAKNNLGGVTPKGGVAAGAQGSGANSRMTGSARPRTPGNPANQAGKQLTLSRPANHVTATPAQRTNGVARNTYSVPMKATDPMLNNRGVGGGTQGVSRNVGRDAGRNLSGVGFTTAAPRSTDSVRGAGSKGAQPAGVTVGREGVRGVGSGTLAAKGIGRAAGSGRMGETRGAGRVGGEGVRRRLPDNKGEVERGVEEEKGEVERGVEEEDGEVFTETPQKMSITSGRLLQSNESDDDSWKDGCY